jgi:hypothetical protein
LPIAKKPKKDKILSSHISHYLFARDSIIESYEAFTIQDQLTLRETNSLQDKFCYVGAQGPDIFFHNQRTMPSGLQIGAVMHRNGYGTFSAYLFEYLLSNDYALGSPEFIYFLSFISHAIMDRYLHPYINYFSGWVELKNEESHKYRHCHSFLERIIDVILLKEIDHKSVQEIDFASKFDLGENFPNNLKDLFLYGLDKTYKRIAQDDKKSIRLQNAYSDSRGYYHYSQMYLDQYQAHLMGTQVSDLEDRWLALLHPLALDPSLDYANNKKITWSDPCFDEETRSMSLIELYDQAKLAVKSIYKEIIGLSLGIDPGPEFNGIAPLVGNSDLRTNIPQSEPCSMQYSQPLPLQKLIHRLSEGTVDKDWFYP